MCIRDSPSAAKLWTEYALSPECVDLAAQNGCYQYPVIDNAASVALPAVIGLSSAPLLLPEDDGSEADAWVDELMAALTEAGADTGADLSLIHICTVVYGRGRAVITATGMDTEMGKIAGVLAQTEQDETPLQRKLTQLGTTLSLSLIHI